MKEIEYTYEQYRMEFEGETVMMFLQRMGNDGWELCTVVSDRAPYSHPLMGVYIFKREKS